MKKTRKITLFVLLLSLVSLLAACLCACSDGINGTNGKDGANGKSAYEIWLDEGHTGTQSDFLDWLKGEDGADGTGGNGSDGEDGKDGQDGKDGKSAYQIWLDNGHTGTEAEFLEWLKGEDGKDGTNGSNGQDGSKGDKGDKGETGVQGEKGENGSDGQDGKSAYQIWLDNGNTGTEAEFLNWLKGQDGINGSDGQDGENGLSAYEIFLKYYPYYTGTEEQWIKQLVNNELKVHTITFQSEVADDITKYVLNGYALTDIPAVPEKEGQTSAKWNITDFSNITADMTVTAEYDMRKYVTFHNDYTEDEDIKITVNYGEAITEVPEVTVKIGNSATWSETDFSHITQDMQVNAVYETIGLQFTLINQQTQYRVSKGEMDIATEELFIPAYHEGKPVTVIDTNAFYTEDYYNRLQFKIAYLPETLTEIRTDAFWTCNNLDSVYYQGDMASYCALIGLDNLMRYGKENKSLYIDGNEIKDDVILPNGITSIANYAFNGCNKLKSIIIPNSVTEIGGYVFQNCSNLTNVTLSNKTSLIFDYLFSGCSSLTSIVIPDSVTRIHCYAFENCTNLTNIVIPNNITRIDEDAFSGCTKLKAVTIGCGVEYISNAFVNCTSLTTVIINPHKSEEYNWDTQTTEIRVSLSIWNNAFKNCSKLETIYFKGTQAEFAQININSEGNTSFTDAMVYYYSETKPTTDGDYWHYDTDGVTPVLWEKEI